MTTPNSSVERTREPAPSFCSIVMARVPHLQRWAAGRTLLNGAKMDDTKRKLLKLVLVCLIWIGLVTGLALLIQPLTP